MNKVPTRDKDSSRYSKVTRRVWSDANFRQLSSPPPNGQTLWFRLLTGTELTNIPGLFAAWEGGLADALKWPLEGFRDAFKEVSAKGMAEADWKAGLVWVPNAIIHNEPTSIHVVTSWRTIWTELPECALKVKAHARLRAYLKSMGESWVKAFDAACPLTSTKPSAKAAPMPSAIQEQEQEQEQDLLDPLPKDLTGSAREPSAEEEEEKASGTSPIVPTDLKSALRVPLAERAAIAVGRPQEARWLQPHRWPEVQFAFDAFGNAWGLQLGSPGDWNSDAGTRAVVGVYAARFTPEQVAEVADKIVRNPVFRKGNRSIGMLSPEVMRRTLAGEFGTAPPGRGPVQTDGDFDPFAKHAGSYR